MIGLTLNTDWTVLADMKVKHVNLPFTGGPGKHRAGVRSPGHVRQGGCEVEYEERTGALDVPDLDLPVGPAAQEDVGDEGVPLEAVDRAVVGQEGCQEL